MLQHIFDLFRKWLARKNFGPYWQAVARGREAEAGGDSPLSQSLCNEIGACYVQLVSPILDSSSAGPTEAACRNRLARPGSCCRQNEGNGLCFRICFKYLHLRTARKFLFPMKPFWQRQVMGKALTMSMLEKIRHKTLLALKQDCLATFKVERNWGMQWGLQILGKHGLIWQPLATNWVVLSRCSAPRTKKRQGRNLKGNCGRIFRVGHIFQSGCYSDSASTIRSHFFFLFFCSLKIVVTVSFHQVFLYWTHPGKICLIVMQFLILIAPWCHRIVAICWHIALCVCMRRSWKCGSYRNICNNLRYRSSILARALLRRRFAK